MRRAIRVKLDFVVEVEDDGCGVPFVGDVGDAIASVAKIVVPSAALVRPGGRLYLGLTRESFVAARRITRKPPVARSPITRSPALADREDAGDKVDPDLDDPDLAPRDFDRVWRVMAEEGSCGEQGGEEYGRVRSEWLEEGRPANMREFIRRRADPRVGDED